MTWSLLFIEDEPDNQFVTVLALERHGCFDVTVCQTAGDALEEAERQAAPFDGVLLDYMLPDMECRQCIELLKCHVSTRDAKIILLTAFIPAGGESAHLKLGVDAVILKPFSISNIGHDIQSVLQSDRIEGPTVSHPG
jgi:CheY-like chemotaxis protein